MQERKMPGLLIDTKLIADIDTIAGYLDKDSNKVMRDLVAAELERIRPLLEAKQALEQSAKQPVSKDLPKILPVEKLAFSKVEEGDFDDIKIAKQNWNEVLEHVLKILCKKGHIKHDKLTSLSLEGSKEGIAQGIEGYQPIEELNISLPSLSAPNIARTIQKIAEKYKIRYEFKLRWSKAESGDSAEQFGLFTSDL